MIGLERLALIILFCCCYLAAAGMAANAGIKRGHGFALPLRASGAFFP